MSKFRDVKTLQKFASIHASIHNHFNLERHLTPRETFKENRAAAMAEWRQLAARYSHNFDIRRLVHIRLTAPVALVIGNDSYKSLPNLNNARTDARGMAAKLKAPICRKSRKWRCLIRHSTSSSTPSRRPVSLTRWFRSKHRIRLIATYA